MTNDEDMGLPEIGQRVVLGCDVDRFPHALVGEGATGEVVQADADQIEVRLDAAVPGLAEWDNGLIWYREQECEEGEALAGAFWRQVRPEAPAPGP
jgi:hypothetical protein